MTSSVRQYVVDLDAPAKQRWVHVVRDYKAEFMAVQAQILEEAEELVGKHALKVEALLRGFLAAAAKTRVVFYGDELQGIADETGMSLGHLVLVQLLYECATCCTSIVLDGDADTPPLLVRTMDWYGDYLRPLTIEVAFQRAKRTVFTATTWAGYVGVLTGMRHNAFGVSVNFRATADGSFWNNIKKALGRAWPNGFLVREVLDDDAATYDAAVAYLADSALIAPCYFTVVGTRAGQGAIITRNINGDEHRL
eukprot:CAMPEP_0198315184 /NCGR_PEP_ID=MMETSP1450-20131203/5542_1 /TAXON_ID=753684 ORGANISM="Madagascaria erythrocladiodes, Strain CCMP3234" /NCGR_SAMPLE_ID=MMETSP1450 /ASSEMBLY_ACC=CAM_ASM_001115 /LENGTH=251 /DNA_ID=CAMNT_0044018283 /DNA_START=66 /DNA_END=818 /DNA_ORIENTATION=+